MKSIVRLPRWGRAAARVACLVLAIVSLPAQPATCVGKFPNPVTDVCWTCVLPISLGNVSIFSKGQNDIDNPPLAPCLCPGLKVGLPIGFWEPARVTEVVRAPYCFPFLGGIKLDPGIPAPEHARAGKTTNSDYAFYQAHHYVFNVFSLLGVVNNNPCLEKNPLDIAYYTEIDPTWGDPALGALFNFESLLFANPIAIAACAADCAASTFGMPLKTLFWCAGCQGSLYPAEGHVAHHMGGVDSSLLLTQRLTSKLHKEFMAFGYHGSAGLCGPYPLPVMDKTAYRTQMLYPIPNTVQVAGRCCQNFGANSITWRAGKEFPVGGEDFAYLMFRKKNCCMATDLGNLIP